MKAPTISLTPQYRATYRQVPYDNRYVFIQMNNFGSSWVNVAQIPSSVFDVSWSQPMLKESFQEELPHLEKFVHRMELYDQQLDAEDEQVFPPKVTPAAKLKMMSKKSFR